MVRLNEIKMQNGKIFLITGANSGLGYETSKFLLERGATVIMCCRDLCKGEKAKQELLKFNFSGVIELVELDLSDLINKFANQNQIIINYIYREEDLKYWDYANSGFYKFKTSFYRINMI